MFRDEIGAPVGGMQFDRQGNVRIDRQHAKGPAGESRPLGLGSVCAKSWRESRGTVVLFRTFAAPDPCIAGARYRTMTDSEVL
jgi:hypothetical protein